MLTILNKDVKIKHVADRKKQFKNYAKNDFKSRKNDEEKSEKSY